MNAKGLRTNKRKVLLGSWQLASRPRSHLDPVGSVRVPWRGCAGGPWPPPGTPAALHPGVCRLPRGQLLSQGAARAQVSPKPEGQSAWT